MLRTSACSPISCTNYEIAVLQAVEAYLKTGKKLPVNIKVRPTPSH